MQSRQNSAVICNQGKGMVRFFISQYTHRRAAWKGGVKFRCYQKKNTSFPANLMPSSEHIKSSLCFPLLAESFVAEISFWELNSIEHDERRHGNDRTSIRNWWSSELAEFQHFWDFRNSHEVYSSYTTLRWEHLLSFFWCLKQTGME